MAARWKTFCCRRASTYASDELGRSGQGVVRLIEWATGQPRIRRMYEHYTKCGRPPELFWHDAIAALRLDLRLNRRPADAIPPDGRCWSSPTIPSASSTASSCAGWWPRSAPTTRS